MAFELNEETRPDFVQSSLMQVSPLGDLSYIRPATARTFPGEAK
jgi:hypothetical protein